MFFQMGPRLFECFFETRFLPREILCLQEWDLGRVRDEFATQTVHIFEQFYICRSEYLCPVQRDALSGEKMRDSIEPMGHCRDSRAIHFSISEQVVATSIGAFADSYVT